MKRKTELILLLVGLIILLAASPSFAQSKMQKLKVGPNGRFLVKEDGSPFVWIGETNWFFTKLPASTIDAILEKRASQGYTVMFISTAAKLYDGSRRGGIYSPNEKYWSYVDDYIEKCEALGMYAALNLGWYRVAQQKSASELYDYGKWAGNRYKNNNNLIWLTLGEGGANMRGSGIPCDKNEAIVRGIREGDTGNKLLTIHADWGNGTSLKTCDAALVDFNNWQSGQYGKVTNLGRMKKIGGGTVWEAIEYDYNQTYNGVHKPTLDAEAWYEQNKDRCGVSIHEIRFRAYFTILAGGLGFTHGSGGLWDGLTSSKNCSASALGALNYPGAEDIGHINKLLSSFGDNLLKLRPKQSIIKSGQSSSYTSHIQAAMANDGSYAVIYDADGGTMGIDMRDFNSSTVTANWFNPRNGSFSAGNTYGNTSSHQSITAPSNEDWVLVLDAGV